MSTLLVDQCKAAAKSVSVISPFSCFSVFLTSAKQTYMPPLSSPSSVALPSDPAPASLGLPIPGHSSPPKKRCAPTIGGRAKQKKTRNA
ncbi:hypothetical protein Hypma_012343 [Hypsizygus marmoreus]|uniref:Uncharacterized protein n=1 Tax=Hypsizygus marmoreus TaxID=39966 RepID=A0A369K8B7_HYPMA|nr:hypothetical protein Hypma_012343 [Hypsizygus marmoreus]